MFLQFQCETYYALTLHVLFSFHINSSLTLNFLLNFQNVHNTVQHAPTTAPQPAWSATITAVRPSLYSSMGFVKVFIPLKCVFDFQFSEYGRKKVFFSLILSFEKKKSVKNAVNSKISILGGSTVYLP